MGEGERAPRLPLLLGPQIPKTPTHLPLPLLGLARVQRAFPRGTPESRLPAGKGSQKLLWECWRWAQAWDPLAKCQRPTMLLHTSQPQPLQDLIREDSPRAPAHTRPAPHPEPCPQRGSRGLGWDTCWPCSAAGRSPAFPIQLAPHKPAQPAPVYGHTSSPRATPTPPPPRPRPSTLPPTRLARETGSSGHRAGQGLYHPGAPVNGRVLLSSNTLRPPQGEPCLPSVTSGPGGGRRWRWGTPHTPKRSGPG